MKNSILPTLAILIFSFSSCTGPVKKAEEKPEVIDLFSVVNKTTAGEINLLLETRMVDSLLQAEKDSLVALPFIKQLTGEKLTALWTNEGKLSRLGDSLFFILQNARHFGLFREDYHFSKIEKLVSAFRDSSAKKYNYTNIAFAEVLMHDAYLKFAAHLNKGRFYADSLALKWKPESLSKNWVSVLKTGIEKKNIRAALEFLEPKQPAYVLLRNEFRKFISEKTRNGYKAIPYTEFAKEGEELNRKIIERLKITGEYTASLKGNDSTKLAEALKIFQKKWLIEPDGKLGKFTKMALGYTHERVIRQLEMVLERWRWEEEKLPEVVFWVNIPSCELKVIEKNKLVFKSNVVCGKPDRETQTPLLKSKIDYMQLFPSWYVPYEIARKEILPVVQRDPAYLRRRKFTVLDRSGNVVNTENIDWKSYSKNNFPFKFAQRMGRSNSLGIVKFNFENPYGVYMHDTNSKGKFKSSSRSASHGCIRVEKYMDVARFLIREDTLKIPYDTLTSYFANTRQRRIEVKNPVPIHTKYFTAISEAKNDLKIYLDIYGKDEKMMKMIYGKK